MGQVDLIKDKIRMARQAFNTVNVAENLAFNVTQDLEEAGYSVKLIKPNEKKPHTWKILPTKELNDEEKEKFEKIKQESTDYWREDTKQDLKDIKKQLLK